MSDDKPIRSLNLDGTLNGPSKEQPVPEANPQFEPVVIDEPLELVQREKRNVEYQDQPPYRHVSDSKKQSRVWIIPVMLVVVLGVGAVVSVLKPALFSTFQSSGALVILSEPSGASISIGTQQLGLTPWAGNNIWSGNQKVTLQLKGYKSMTKAFDGKKEVTVSFELERAR
jgi:PEGA domain